jgi:hypothetical protein
MTLEQRRTLTQAARNAHGSCSDGCTCGNHRGRVFEEKNYGNIHARVARSRGLAKNYICIDCGNSAEEWSQVHGTDGLNPSTDFVPRCVTCHRGYDGWPEMISNAQRRRWAATSSEERSRMGRLMNEAKAARRRVE